MESLKAELDITRENKGGYLPHDQMQIADAENNRVSNPIPSVGDKAVDFELPNNDGNIISLKSMLRDGPVILNFFRGNFCEYCQLELKALQRSMKEFELYSASLVGISPSTVTVQTVTRDSHELSYSILSDVGNKVASMYGLSYNLSEELVTVFEGFGMDFDENFGADSEEEPELAIPATFLIARDRTIVFAFADYDHTKRAEPSDIIASLISLN
jgi:peroxiredoxin